MEVDQPAPLILGDFGVRQPNSLGEFAPREPYPPGDLTAQLQSEAVPESARVCLPEHGSGVVVAARTERFTEPRVVVRVPCVATGRRAVRTGGPRLTGSAGPYPAVAFPAGVNRAEAGSGEGGEHPGVLADHLPNVLAADESGTDQLVRVRLIEAGTGRADRCPAVAACGEQPTAVDIRAVREQRSPVDESTTVALPTR
jgi:hypothetical protein